MSQIINNFNTFPFNYNFQNSEPKKPLVTISEFVEISPEKRVKEIQVYSRNEVVLSLEGNHQVAIEPCFLDLPNICGDSLAEYLSQTHFVVTELADGSYKMTATPRLLGGGCGQSKQVSVAEDRNKKSTTSNRQLQSTANVVNPSTNQSKREALINACNKEGSLEKVKAAIEKGASVNYETESGTFALNTAASFGHVDIIEYLLSIGANINSIDKEKFTPLGRAIVSENYKAAEFLMSKGANTLGDRGIKIEKLNMVLWKACTERGSLQEARMAIDAGADVNTRNSEQSSPLISAASWGHANIVEYLLSQGAEINFIDKNGWSALGEAFRSGKQEAADILIKNGASTIGNKKILCSQTSSIEVLNEILRGACAKGGKLDLVKMAFDAGAEVNSTHSNGNSALILAASWGHVDIVKYLLSQGAKIDAADINGNTPLKLALQNNHLDVADLLLINGASPGVITSNLSPDAKRLLSSYSLNNALKIACRNGNINEVDSLIKQGADINRPLDENGATALHITAEGSNYPFMDYLISKGANIDAIDKMGWTPFGYALCKNSSLTGLLSNLGSKKPFNISVLKNHKGEKEKLNQILCAVCAGIRQIHQIQEGEYVREISIPIFSADLDFVKMLVDAGADINNRSGEKKSSPLHSAASGYNNAEIIEYFATRISYLDTINQEGWTALGIAFLQQNKDALRILLNHGAKKIGDKSITKSNQESNDTLNYILCNACGENGDLETVKMAIDAGADVNANHPSGDSPLFIAAAWGHISIVKHLISEGATLDFIHKTGWTPLGIALKCEKSEVVNTLQKVGAKKIGDKRLLSSQTDTMNSLNSMLFIVCKGYAIEIARMAVDAGANINATSIDGFSPLHYAVGFDRADITEYYLSQGADFNIINKTGWTPLGYAYGCGKDETANILLKKGANKLGDNRILMSQRDQMATLNYILRIGCEKNSSFEKVKMAINAGADINAVDTFGNTPLILAASWGHVDIVEHLIARGAAIEVMCNKGETALAYACKCDKIACVNLLLRNGADPAKILPSVYDALSKDMKHILYVHTEQNKDRPAAAVNKISALNAACGSGDINAVRQAINNGGRPDTQTLTRAFLTQNMQIIDAVLALGAKPDDKTLTTACSTGHVVFVNKALSVGAQPTQETYKIAQQVGGGILSLLPKW